MLLTADAVREFHRDGCLLLPRLFSIDEAHRIRDRMLPLYREESPGTVFEEGTNVVRALHGLHLMDLAFQRLAQLPRLLEPCRQLLGGSVYIHQYKMTAKPAFIGQSWPWHQDSQYWIGIDGLQRDACVNAVIFLDEVHDTNGPIQLVRGSHRALLSDDATSSGDWRSHMGTRLPYQVPSNVLRQKIEENGIFTPTGVPGSVLLFHASLFHGSLANESSDHRRLLIISYSHIDNAPKCPSPRPSFLAARSYDPLSMLQHDSVKQVLSSSSP